MADFGRSGINYSTMYMKDFMEVCYDICSIEEYNDIVAFGELADMSNFPDTGSVRTIGNVIVIKLSDL